MRNPLDLHGLSLDSGRWGELGHAYGNASDVPGLLRQLEAAPNDQEAWSSIWSALAHQGDVYAASFATVPHVIRILAATPATAGFSYFQFPAIVEIWRQQKNVEIPNDLRANYFAALAALPSLVALTATRDWDGDFLASALSAIAAAKGFGKVAGSVLEMTDDVPDQFLEWFYSR